MFLKKFCLNCQSIIRKLYVLSEPDSVIYNFLSDLKVSRAAASLRKTWSSKWDAILFGITRSMPKRHKR